MVPEQHAVERVCGGDQLMAVGCEHDAVDQRVDGLVGDADEIKNLWLSIKGEIIK